MTKPSPRPAFRSCPSCGGALNRGAMTCSSCGGLVVVESLFGRLRAETRYQASAMGDRLKDRQVLLWTLALCPIVILPPVLAIFLSFRRPSGDQPLAPGQGLDLLVIVASVCNIILSVMFWRWIGDAAISMGLSIGLFLKSFGITHPGVVPQPKGGVGV